MHTNDYSWMSVSSISTADENSDLDSDCEIADVPMPPPSHDSETFSDIDSTSRRHSSEKLSVICRDNIDKSVKHKHMKKVR